MIFFKKLLAHVAYYVTAITTAVFVFASIAGVSELTMSFRRYILILLFSVLSASMENVFSAEKLAEWSKYALHYLTLATAFYFVFMNVKTSAGSSRFNFASVVASLVIFTVCYAVFFIVKKRISKYTTPTNTSKKTKKEAYKSIFE